MSQIPQSHQPPKLPAVIVDMDGTLADLNGRLPYGDAQAHCGNDLIREHVRQMVWDHGADGKAILIVSGRFDTYAPQTREWLERHNVPFDELFMREAGDGRSDDIIKQEIYQEDIEPYYEVVEVIDDRPKVIRMWRALNLNVVDVGKGIEF